MIDVERFDSLPKDVQSRIDSILLQEYRIWSLYIKIVCRSKNINTHLYGDN